jgi:hypothetical protein
LSGSGCDISQQKIDFFFCQYIEFTCKYMFDKTFIATRLNCLSPANDDCDNDIPAYVLLLLTCEQDMQKK